MQLCTSFTIEITDDDHPSEAVSKSPTIRLNAVIDLFLLLLLLYTTEPSSISMQFAMQHIHTFIHAFPPADYCTIDSPFLLPCVAQFNTYDPQFITVSLHSFQFCRAFNYPTTVCHCMSPSPLYELVFPNCMQRYISRWWRCHLWSEEEGKEKLQLQLKCAGIYASALSVLHPRGLTTCGSWGWSLDYR